MKIRFLLALVGLVPTFAQQTNTPHPKLRQQLDAFDKKNDEAFNNNDAAAVAALFTEDAVARFGVNENHDHRSRFLAPLGRSPPR